MHVFLLFSRGPTRGVRYREPPSGAASGPVSTFRALPSVPCAQQHRGNWLGRLPLAVSRRQSGRESVRSPILPRLPFKSHVLVVVNQTRNCSWASLGRVDAGNVVAS